MERISGGARTRDGAALISELMNGRLERFSLERLGRYLTRMKRAIVVKVVKRKRRGRWTVAA